MRNHKLKMGGVLAASLVAVLYSASAAASINYSFSGGGQNVTGATYTATDGPDVVVSGWANTVTNATATKNDDALAAQNVYAWGGGLGVVNSQESNTYPNHSTDNAGPEDMVLFSFASDIALTGLSIGWSYNDSDMTVLAYTGSNAPDLAGKTYGDLTASGGWTLISHLANVPTGSTGASFNDGTSKVSSSYWLVGAYNPLVGNSMGWTENNDYLKISGLMGEMKTPPNGGGGQVPEPATLFLLGTGLMWMGWMRRREMSFAAVKNSGSLIC